MMLTPSIARKPKKEISEEMESFHRDVVAFCMSSWGEAIGEDGCCYTFKCTEAWVYPPEATKGIPTTVCLN